MHNQLPEASCGTTRRPQRASVPRVDPNHEHVPLTPDVASLMDAVVMPGHRQDPMGARSTHRNSSRSTATWPCGTTSSSTLIAATFWPRANDSC